MARRARWIAGLAATIGLAAASRDAAAAGLYVSDRGVRPLGRGGAFVAGADDLGAIWYNPAGIVATPSSLLLDGSWIDYSDTYTRQAMTMSSGASGQPGTMPPMQAPTTFVQSLRSVNGSTPFLPIPTVAASYRWSVASQKLAVAAGVYAPDAALLSYPSDGPQRYSLVSLNGSILAVLGGWFAYQPVEQLQVGVGVQMLTGFFRTTVDFSACVADHFMCASEDPSYDALGKLATAPIFAPSANAGMTWIPDHLVRVGLSAQAPFVVDSSATVDVRLPSAVFFDSAHQDGNSAHVHLELPPVLRAGVELRPLASDDLRVELSYVREFWSVQKSLDINPQGITIDGITGFPPKFGVGAISVPRGMVDSNSIRLGGEYGYTLSGVRLAARAGVAYETSSIPASYVTPFTVDGDKVVASIGGSIFLGPHLRLDGVISHPFQSDVNVDARTASVPIINPVQGNQTMLDRINGGSYHVDLWVIGGGLEYRFE
ncbi:MAG: OmpP1/FadL family transporter [Polyangiaceae bacterium]